jgi:predicted acetyltransferase
MDGLWVNVRKPAACLEARRYATADRLVLEISDGCSPGRYALDAGPQGASCRPVRTNADLTMTNATLGALLYGGVRPSRLAAARKLEARTADVLRRADLFFPMAPLPYCQTAY